MSDRIGHQIGGQLRDSLANDSMVLWIVLDLSGAGSGSRAQMVPKKRPSVR
jgi:hypothetical protein